MGKSDKLSQDPKWLKKINARNSRAKILRDLGVPSGEARIMARHSFKLLRRMRYKFPALTPPQKGSKKRKKAQANAPTTNTQLTQIAMTKDNNIAKELGVPLENVIRLSEDRLSGPKQMGVKSTSLIPEKPPEKGKNEAKRTPKNQEVNKPSSSHPPPQPLQEPIWVGIKNSSTMTDAQLSLLTNALLENIAGMPQGEGPTFNGYSRKPGWLILNCVNQRSKSWLQKVLPTLEPWPGASLSLQYDQLPKTHVAKVFLPDEYADISQTFSLFRMHNNDLHTDQWKVLTKQTINKIGVVLHLSLDSVSAENLQKMHCRPSLGSRRILFKLKKKVTESKLAKFSPVSTEVPLGLFDPDIPDPNQTPAQNDPDPIKVIPSKLSSTNSAESALSNAPKESNKVIKSNIASITSIQKQQYPDTGDYKSVEDIRQDNFEDDSYSSEEDNFKGTNYSSGEAGPARDEAMALSANAALAVRDAVSDSEARASASEVWETVGATKKARNANRGRGHSGAGTSAGIVQPFPLGLKRGHAPQDPARGPAVAGARGVPSGTVADCSRPLPNRAGVSITVEKATAPQGAAAASGGETATRKRQKRRINARARSRLADGGTSQGASTSVAGMVQQKRPLGTIGDSSLPSSDPKRAKITTSFAEVAASERMAVIPLAFPADKIGMEHLSAIQGFILEQLVVAPDPLPRITFGNIVAGALHVNCQGRESTAWLRTAIGGGEIAGLRLKVVDAKDLPKPVKMAWRTKIIGAHDLKLLLRVLQRYNPGLHTEEWKVVDTVATEAYTRRIILMDRVSADVIKAAGYQLHSGVDLGSFKLLDDAEERGLEGAEDAGVEMLGSELVPAGVVGGAVQGEGAPPSVDRVDAKAAEAVIGGQSGSGAGARVRSRGSFAGSRTTRESSPISEIGSKDLRGMAELFLDSTQSPMSYDETAQEAAADLSMPKH